MWLDKIQRSNHDLYFEFMTLCNLISCYFPFPYVSDILFAVFWSNRLISWCIWTVLWLFFPQIFAWLSPHEYSNFNWLIFFPDLGSKYVVDQFHPSLSLSVLLVHLISHRICFLTSAIQVCRVVFGTLCIVHISSSPVLLCLLSSLTRMCSSWRQRPFLPRISQCDARTMTERQWHLDNYLLKEWVLFVVDVHMWIILMHLRTVNGVSFCLLECFLVFSLFSGLCEHHYSKQDSLHWRWN